MSNPRTYKVTLDAGHRKNEDSSVAEVAGLGACLTALAAAMPGIPVEKKGEFWWHGMGLRGEISMTVGRWTIKIEAVETVPAPPPTPVEGNTSST